MQPNSSYDIIVTAQKRSERLSDVPLSITAATGEQLERRGITSAADLAKIAPGFTFSQSQNGTPVFSVRGVGFYSETIAAASTVTVYVDQIPLPYARMTEGATLDLERVEVLKGPQGTLFGQNSTAGAINYIAAKPTAEPEGAVSLTYGRFNQIDVDGHISGPLSDTLSARLAFRSERRDDWQKSSTRDETTGQHNFMAARLLLDWKPTERLSFELNVNGWRDRSDTQVGQARSYLPVAPGPALTPQTLATQTALINYPYVTSNDNRLTDWDVGRSRRRNDRFYQIALRGDYELTDDIKLISLSSYTHMRLFDPIDGDATNVPALTVDQTGRLRAFTQELRVEGDSGPLKWVVGGNYQYSKSNELQNNRITGSNAQVPLPPDFTTGIHHRGNRLLNNQRVRSIAGFANADYALTDTIRFQAGIRYTKENRDFSGCVADTASDPFGLRVIYPPFVVPGQCLTLLPDGSFGLFNSKLDEHNVSWRAGLNWKPNPQTLLYANVTKGYKTGDFGTLPGLDYRLYEPVRQESVLAYEAGFKTSLLDRMADVSGAVFYYDYADKQTQGQRNLPPFGNLPFLVNVPKARVVGAEMDLTLRPMTGLRINLAGTYVNSKVNGTAIVASPFAPVTVDARGDVLPNTPKWQGTADVEYSFPVSGNAEAYIGASASYRSKAYAALGATRGPAGTEDTFKIDGYSLIDLRAGVTFDKRYTVQLWGKNVTNKNYWNNVTHIYDTVDRVTGQPATYGVTLSAKF
ncbi:TonB-dependent receptor [Sphingobium sp. EM0848]|uniref:TonB-dependent receptor n=1 Tax=Sphingobium sp. EM0848 TaxID=2743473 RepID=UPI00159C3481